MKTAGCSFGGEFKFRILDAERKLKRETDWIPNLITDIGLDRIVQGAVGNYCRIGTGNTAPANANTALVSQTEATNVNVGDTSLLNAGAPDYESVFTTTYEFPLGSVVGNMAEIGVGWEATGDTLFSRALILDGVGAPTTISVTAEDILQATYRLTAYPTLTDSTGTVDVSGVTYDYTARVSSCEGTIGLYVNYSMISGNGVATAYDGVLGAITDAPTGDSAGLGGAGLFEYTPGSHYIDYGITGTLVQGNLAGGIKSIRVSLSGTLGTFLTSQIEFAPNIPKDGTKVFAMTLRQSWSRH